MNIENAAKIFSCTNKKNQDWHTCCCQMEEECHYSNPCGCCKGRNRIEDALNRVSTANLTDLAVEWLKGEEEPEKKLSFLLTRFEKKWAEKTFP